MKVLISDNQMRVYKHKNLTEIKILPQAIDYIFPFATKFYYLLATRKVFFILYAKFLPLGSDKHFSGRGLISILTVLISDTTIKIYCSKPQEFREMKMLLRKYTICFYLLLLFTCNKKYIFDTLHENFSAMKQ